MIVLGHIVRIVDWYSVSSGSLPAITEGGTRVAVFVTYPVSLGRTVWAVPFPMGWIMPWPGGEWRHFTAAGLTTSLTMEAKFGRLG